MRVERYQARPRRRSSSGCGCLLLTFSGLILAGIAFVFFIIPILPAVAMRVAGFQPIAVSLNDSNPKQPPVVQLPQSLSQITINAGSLGQRTITQTAGTSLQIGTSDTGTTVVQAIVTENGITDLCQQYTQVCSSTGSPLRNARVDLQNNHLIMSGDAYIDRIGAWQSLSVVMGVDTTNRVSIIGVDIGGTLFSVPDGDFASIVSQVEQTANQTLQNLSIQANGTSYGLYDITVVNDQLYATFR